MAGLGGVNPLDFLEEPDTVRRLTLIAVGQVQEEIRAKERRALARMIRNEVVEGIGG